VTPADEVLACVSRTPQSIGDLGLAVASLRGHDPAGAAGEPVGQWLASVGLSLSALQKVVDGLVADERVVEVRGRELWDLQLPTAGTKAQGRYYLSPA
jgi:hypothetical protein